MTWPVRPTQFLSPWWALALVSTVLGCATLPDSAALIAQHSEQAAQFQGARGPLSARKNAAISTELKRKSGDLNMLDLQISLEQTISASPLTLGNKVTLLEDGSVTYAAMFAAIAQAKDHINLETYILEDDAAGHEFGIRLLQAQARGVQVNLIYDSVGGLGTAKAFFARLRQAGVAVLEFNPINPLAAKGAWLLNHRDHRKMLLVDGRIVILGGINISSVYGSGSALRRAGKPSQDQVEWRDTDLQIDGPAVAEFQKLFLQTWVKQHGMPLAAKNYFPPLTSRGQDMVRALGSSPDQPYSLIYLTLLSAIGNAQQHVRLTSAYFVPDPQLLLALTAAAARGVEVQLILPSHSDSALVLHAGRAHYADLLRSGVQIFERQGALLHAKTAVIDGVWSTVGSSNLDWRSFLFNDELNAIVLGREFAAQMQAMFQKDLRASQRIDPQAWAERAVQFKLKEWAAQLWQRWL